MQFVLKMVYCTKKKTVLIKYANFSYCSSIVTKFNEKCYETLLILFNYLEKGLSENICSIQKQ